MPGQQVNEDVAHMLPALFFLVNKIGEDNEIKIKLLIKSIMFILTLTLISLVFHKGTNPHMYLFRYLDLFYLLRFNFSILNLT